jgi:hypothetical protein
MTLIAVEHETALDYQYLDLDRIAITPNTRSKKAFKAYVEANPDAVCLIEPAHRFGLVSQGPTLTAREAVGQAVTNHPRRTWFGTITRTKDGSITVK